MTLDHHLSQLESAGLVQIHTLDPDVEYLFRHALVRDAAYDSLLRKDRAVLHGKVGEVLEALFADQREALAPQLARHFELAGDASRAADYYLIAGERALATFANGEAVGYLQSALDLASTDAHKLPILRALGEALHRAAKLDEAIVIWRQALDLALGARQSDLAARLYVNIAVANRDRGTEDQALLAIEEGLAVLEGAPESEGIAILYRDAARRLMAHRPDEGRSYAQRAFDLAQQLGSSDERAQALVTLARYAERTDPQQAVAMMLEAEQLAQAAPLSQTMVGILSSLRMLMKRMDDERADTYDARYLEVVRRRSVPTEVARMLTNLIDPSLAQGRLDEAESLLNELQALVDTHRLTLSQAALDSYRPHYWSCRGMLDQAEAGFSRAFDRLLANPSNATDHVFAIGGVGAYYSILLVWQGRWQEAGEVIAKTIARVELNHAYLWLMDDWSRLWACYMRQGRKADADQALEKLRGYLSEMSEAAQARERQWIDRETARAESRFDDAIALTMQAIESASPPFARWLYEDAANIHLERNQAGDRAAAIRCLTEARSIAARMNAHGWVTHYDARLAALHTESDSSLP